MATQRKFFNPKSPPSKRAPFRATHTSFLIHKDPKFPHTSSNQSREEEFTILDQESTQPTTMFTSTHQATMFSSTARDPECSTLSSRGKVWLKPRKESIQEKAVVDSII